LYSTSDIIIVVVQFDIPASINYVRRVTGVAQVNWVAHSQGEDFMNVQSNFHFFMLPLGATISIACFSSNPAVAKQVKLFVALAPVTYMVRSLLQQFIAPMIVFSSLDALGLRARNAVLCSAILQQYMQISF
jgi:hypothetical protein